MASRPITIAAVLARAIEVSPDDASFLISPGKWESGRDLAKRLAAQKRQVRFFRWRGGATVAVIFPMGPARLSSHEMARAYRNSMSEGQFL